jgi:hypothetical protein
MMIMMMGTGPRPGRPAAVSAPRARQRHGVLEVMMTTLASCVATVTVDVTVGGRRGSLALTEAQCSSSRLGGLRVTARRLSVTVTVIARRPGESVEWSNVGRPDGAGRMGIKFSSSPRGRPGPRRQPELSPGRRAARSGSESGMVTRIFPGPRSRPAARAASRVRPRQWQYHDTSNLNALRGRRNAGIWSSSTCSRGSFPGSCQWPRVASSRPRLPVRRRSVSARATEARAALAAQGRPARHRDWQAASLSASKWRR